VFAQGTGTGTGTGSGGGTDDEKCDTIVLPSYEVSECDPPIFLRMTYWQIDYGCEGKGKGDCVVGIDYYELNCDGEIIDSQSCKNLSNCY